MKLWLHFDVVICHLHWPLTEVCYHKLNECKPITSNYTHVCLTIIAYVFVAKWRSMLHSTHVNTWYSKKAFEFVLSCFECFKYSGRICTVRRYRETFWTLLRGSQLCSTCSDLLSFSKNSRMNSFKLCLVKSNLRQYAAVVREMMHLNVTYQGFLSKQISGSTNKTKGKDHY